MTSALRLVFWETTKACNLSCRHCRAVPRRTLGPTELDTRRALTLIDQIAEVAKPVFWANIFTFLACAFWGAVSERRSRSAPSASLA